MHVYCYFTAVGILLVKTVLCSSPSEIVNTRVISGKIVPATAFEYTPIRKSKSLQEYNHPRGTWEVNPAGYQDITVDSSRGNTPYNNDRVQVVSSSLTILPKKKSQRNKRETREWRRPRDHQFVTSSSSETRSARRLEPVPIRYYPEERSGNDFYYNRDRPNSFANQKRIIYYATLPEIVRPPRDWNYYPPPPPPYYPPSYPGYPPIRDNEIVTRVTSNVIDVSSNRNRDRYSKPSNSYDSLPPKFTIIDDEPSYGYDQQYDRFNRYDNYKDQYYKNPYHYYQDMRDRPPPPNELNILKRPLDVRPLDPIKDITTPSSPATTTLNPIQAFERSFKY